MPPGQSFPVAHAGSSLPLPTDVALVLMAVGVFVLVVVAYDAYRVYGERVAQETETDHV